MAAAAAAVPAVNVAARAARATVPVATACTFSHR